MYNHIFPAPFRKDPAMIRRLSPVVLAIFVLPFFTLHGAHAQDKEDLSAKVRTAIDKGVHYLKTTQRDGNWEHVWQPPIPYMKNGTTCLALLALLECGVPPDDRTIVAGLNHLRDM